MSESDDAVKSWAAVPADKKRWVRKDKIRRVHLFIMCRVADKALAEWEGKLLRVKKAPRRLSLRQTDFLKFGSTEGCKGCAWISHRLGRHPGHNNVCRKRLETAFASSNDAVDRMRVQNQQTKIDAFLLAAGERRQDKVVQPNSNDDVHDTHLLVRHRGASLCCRCGSWSQGRLLRYLATPCRTMHVYLTLAADKVTWKSKRQAQTWMHEAIRRSCTEQEERWEGRILASIPIKETVEGVHYKIIFKDVPHQLFNNVVIPTLQDFGVVRVPTQQERDHFQKCAKRAFQRCRDPKFATVIFKDVPTTLFHDVMMPALQDHGIVQVVTHSRKEKKRNPCSNCSLKIHKANKSRGNWWLRHTRSHNGKFHEDAWRRRFGRKREKIRTRVHWNPTLQQHNGRQETERICRGGITRHLPLLK